MSIAQTQPLVDALVKAKIPKKTATDLIDFVEKHQSQELKQDIEKVKLSIDFLKWVIGLGLTLIFSIIIYLHSDTNKRIDKLESKIDKIERKIDRLLIK